MPHTSYRDADRINDVPVSIAAPLPVASYDANGNPTGTSANPAFSKPAPYNFLGYQPIAAATLANSTPLSIPAGATVAIVQNNTNQIARFRPDGATTPPTTSTGQRLAVNGSVTLDIRTTDLTATRFILEAAGTGTFDVMYYN